MNLLAILIRLQSQKTCATYGAVAGVAGGTAVGLGRRLGLRRPLASWVVNAKTKRPTGYAPHQIHPACDPSRRLIRTAPELWRFLRAGG